MPICFFLCLSTALPVYFVLDVRTCNHRDAHAQGDSQFFNLLGLNSELGPLLVPTSSVPIEHLT